MMFKTSDPPLPKTQLLEPGETHEESPAKINKTTQIQYIMKVIERQSKEIHNLKTELSKVKSQVYTQKKKKAKFTLETIPCSYNLKSWIDGIKVNDDTISIVFSYDLKMGLRYLLSNEIKKTEGQLPLISFKEKENTVYYYNDQGKWDIMKKNGYFYLVNHLSLQILRYYTEWKAKQTFTQAQENEHVKDYFKICGNGTTEDAMMNYIKKWMYTKVKIEGQIDDL